MKTIQNIKKIFLVALMLTLATGIVNAQDRTRIYMGLRLPQMNTAERTNIGAELSPQHARGQMVFNTDSVALQYWDGTKWVSLNDHKSILEYIVNNMTQELVDSIMTGVTITSADETVKVVGSGTSSIDLSVDITTVADSLINNSWFIQNLITTLFENNSFIDSLVNNLVNNTTFIEELIGNEYFIENLVVNQQFIDSIVNNLVNNQTFIDSMVNNFLSHNYFMDSIVNNLINSNTFIDSIINKIAVNITEEFVDSIMAKVSVTGKRGIVVTGSGTSNITVELPKGESDGQILVWNEADSTWRPAAPAAIVRQLTIPIPIEKGTFTTENLIFYGTTSTATNPLQVVNIEPVFSDIQMRRIFLRVDASVTVDKNAAEWSVSIDNRNFSPGNEFRLISVVVSYICSDDSALTSDLQNVMQIAGF